MAVYTDTIEDYNPTGAFLTLELARAEKELFDIKKRSNILHCKFRESDAKIAANAIRMNQSAHASRAIASNGQKSLKHQAWAINSEKRAMMEYKAECENLLNLRDQSVILAYENSARC